MTWETAETWIDRGWAVLVSRDDRMLVIETKPWTGRDGSVQGPIRFTVYRGEQP